MSSYNTSSLRRAVDCWLDGVALGALLLLSTIMYRINIVFTILMLLSCIDQFDDIYYAVNGRHLYPDIWIFRLCNFFLELVCLLVAIGLFIFSSIYAYAFSTPFWVLMNVLSALLVYSTLRDIFESFRKRRIMVRIVGV